MVNVRNKELEIARGVSLPLSAVTSTFGILAVRGAGKTNAARVLAECMFHAGLPFVAVDPVGSCWGLRAGRNGQASGGLPIAIFGGDHADIPLTRNSGQLIADLIVNQRLTCVVDLSGFEHESDRKAFLLPFAQRLYQRNRDPLHLFLEECDDYIPQRPMRDELALKRAWENIVRRGRGRGLGITLITQRSAVVNKDVLTQVETLFVLRTTGPQDIKAIEAWTKYHDFGQKELGTLAGLEDGEAWVWSPHFLKAVKRFKFKLSQTFDSGATPSNVRGREARKSATLYDIDVKAIRAAVEATIEKNRQDDPVALRRHVAELKQELRKAQASQQNEQLWAEWDEKRGRAIGLLRQAQSALESALECLRKSAENRAVQVQTPSQQTRPKKEATVERSEPGEKLGTCARAILRILVSRHPRTSTAAQVAIITSYSVTSGGFANALSQLRSRKLMTGGRHDLLATDLAMQQYGSERQPLPTGSQLLEHWKNELGKCEAALLQVLYDARSELTKTELAERSNYSVTSGGFANALSRLRILELIKGYQQMTLAEEFSS